jgi:rod shape-determining protein MreC
MRPPDPRLQTISKPFTPSLGLTRWRWLTARLALIGLVAAGLILLGMSRAAPERFAGLRGSANDSMTVVLNILRWPLVQAHAVGEAVSSYFAVRQRNQRLEAELKTLRDLQERERQLRLQNAELTRLLGVVEPQTRVVASARIVGASSASYVNSALLPIGRSKGLRVGQPVRAADGLVGRIIEVGGSSARVMLLSDLSSRVPVKVARTGQAGIAAGSNSPVLRLRFLPPGAGLVTGDVLVTSGHGGLFPPGIPVARVTDPQAAEPLVEPFAQMSGLGVVLVLAPYFPAAATPRP